MRDESVGGTLPWRRGWFVALTRDIDCKISALDSIVNFKFWIKEMDSKLEVSSNVVPEVEPAFTVTILLASLCFLPYLGVHSP